MSSSGFLPVTVEHVVGDPLDDLRARVVRLVDAVAEAHQRGLRRAFTRLMKSGTFSTEPISFSIRSTASLAPPCSGP